MSSVYRTFLGVVTLGLSLIVMPAWTQAVAASSFQLLNRTADTLQVECSVDDTTLASAAPGSHDEFTCTGTVTVQVEGDGDTTQHDFSFQCETGQVHTATVRTDTDSGALTLHHQCGDTPAYTG